METPITILYEDKRVVVALKPAGVLSTDEPGGMPELLRSALGTPNGCIRTVHRLDQVVGGVMVYARSAVAASELSRQVREHDFQKKYLAVVEGYLQESVGCYRDLLYRSKRDRKTYVVPQEGKGVQEAELLYEVLDQADGLSLVEITLRTGRTHQIRAQFSHHGHPLVGDRKYGSRREMDYIALWSRYVGFYHPETGRWKEFDRLPPAQEPWTRFSALFDRQELLDVVDEEGNPTGAFVDRETAHRQGIQHRTSHVWLLRKRAGKVQVLLQKRSEGKDSYPGRYDISSAGHIPAGVDFVPSALRELKEELGIQAAPEELISCGIRRFQMDREFHGKPFHDRQVSRVFALWRDTEQFSLQPSEVSEVCWMDYEECLQGVQNNTFPNCIYVEELELLRPVMEREQEEQP